MNALQRHLKVRSYPDRLAFYIEEEEQDLKSSRGIYIFFHFEFFVYNRFKLSISINETILFMLEFDRPTRAEVKKGQTIRLNCKATGFPKPNYAWYKDGGRLSSFHDRFRVTFTFQIRKLHI